ncbi:MAG: hypothetical protein OXL37_13400 [Chloroflexota bacterium]|nr:hypothetical protein [Chloroflexota bacterium]MDE2959253.1 hypothetical protein [Chloroflexota bacterium]
MVKVALTFEGDADDVIVAIRRLAVGDATVASSVGTTVETSAASAPAESSDEAQPDAPPAVPEGRWTIEHVRAFWGFLADDAREIYQRVAQSAGYVLSRQALLEEMHLTVRQLSGRLSSQGHAVRRIRRVHNVSLPHPMSFDSQADEYKMLPDVADAIVRLNL